jgi:hypothetical protein
MEEIAKISIGDLKNVAFFSRKSEWSPCTARKRSFGKPRVRIDVK